MYKRNVRGNLYHPGGTAQDVSTLKLCSIATGEIQLCVVPTHACPAFRSFSLRPCVVLKKAGGQNHDK